MAHFAELDADNIVLRVVVIANEDCTYADGNESEEVGIAFCKTLWGDDTRWVQTSYNGNTRGGYAGVGFKYDPKKDKFVDVRPPVDPTAVPELPAEPTVAEKLERAGITIDELKAALGL